MDQIETSLRSRRLAAGKRLIDLAIDADVSPSTVRCFELGVPVRRDLQERLVESWRRLCPDRPPT